MEKINKAPPESVKISAAHKTIEELIEYGIISDCYKDKLVSDLAKCAEINSDGYDLGRDLECCYNWEMSARIVEALDGHGHTLERMRDEWLKFETKDVVPPFKIGDRIKWPRGSGVINGIYPYRPISYTVTRDGETDPSRSSILWFDDVYQPEES